MTSERDDGKAQTGDVQGRRGLKEERGKGVQGGLVRQDKGPVLQREPELFHLHQP